MSVILSNRRRRRCRRRRRRRRRRQRTIRFEDETKFAKNGILTSNRSSRLIVNFSSY